MTRSLILIITLTLSACAAPTTAIPPTSAPAPNTVTPPQRAQPTAASSPLPAITPTRSAQTNFPGNVPSQVPSCPSDASAPLFNTVPIDPNDFLAFRPLGFQSPPIHIFPAKHSAFSMTKPGDKPVAKPVKAPGKVWVVEIWEASFSTGGKNYQVYMYPCNQVRVYWGHLATISEKLLAEFKKGEPKCNSFNDGTATVTTCRREGLTITLEPGEQWATGPDTAGVDLGVADFRLKPAAFVKPEHYDSYYVQYASPLDYFTPETKKVLEAKTGNVFGNKMRTAPPIGGDYMQDIIGTAQGNWFTGGKYANTSTDWSSFLGLAHDYVDPAQPVIGAGSTIKNMNMGLYSFKAEREGLINRDFNEVKADGKIYCYENFLPGQSAGGMPLNKPNGVLILTLPTETTLKVEFISGASCKALPAFTANVTMFER